MPQECRECQLEIKPFKQVMQQEEDVCEYCTLAAMGFDELSVLEED